MEEGDQIFFQRKGWVDRILFYGTGFSFQISGQDRDFFYAEIDGNDGSAAVMEGEQDRFAPHGGFFRTAEFYDELAVKQFLHDGGYGCFCQMQHFGQIGAGKRRMVGNCFENQGAVHVSYIFLISGIHKKSSILPHRLYLNLNTNGRERTGKIEEIEGAPVPREQ